MLSIVLWRPPIIEIALLIFSEICCSNLNLLTIATPISFSDSTYSIFQCLVLYIYSWFSYSHCFTLFWMETQKLVVRQLMYTYLFVVIRNLNTGVYFWMFLYCLRISRPPSAPKLVTSDMLILKYSVCLVFS